MAKTYLQAAGGLTCVGHSLQAMANRLFQGSSLVMADSASLFDGSETPIGKVRSPLLEVPQHLSHFSCRNNQFLLTALEQVSESLQTEISTHGLDRGAIILGTSTSGIAEAELRTDEKSYDYRRQEIGNMSQFLEAITGIHNISYTLSTACSSSGRALLTAHKLIQNGLCDYALVGGSDTLCQLTLNGFHSLEALSTQPTNPFSKNRRGINIGEGAALFVLSRTPSAVAISGVGESSDGYHISSPDPEGHGPEEAIRQALMEAGLKPSDIGYINLHGTGTQKNDAMESKVVNRIFANSAPASSTKPFFGHTLGAAGAIEALACYLTLHSQYNPNGQIPHHQWDSEPDLSLPRIPLAPPGSLLRSQFCMSNSFAFGGNNVSLIFSREDNKC